MKKYTAEFIGTFTLVLFGCGTAVVSGNAVGHLGIAFAFGFALWRCAMALVLFPDVMLTRRSVWGSLPRVT